MQPQTEEKIIMFSFVFHFCFYSSDRGAPRCRPSCPALIHRRENILATTLSIVPVPCTNPPTGTSAIVEDGGAWFCSFCCCKCLFVASQERQRNRVKTRRQDLLLFFRKVHAADAPGLTGLGSGRLETGSISPFKK